MIFLKVHSIHTVSELYAKKIVGMRKTRAWGQTTERNYPTPKILDQRTL